MLAALASMCLSVPASASPASLDFVPSGVTEHCVATIDPAADLAASRADLEWTCEEPSTAYSLVAERSVLRFRLPEGALDGGDPYFATRRAPFGAVQLLVVDEDGAARSASYGYDELEPAMIEGLIKAPFPEVTGTTRHVYVAIDQPTNPLTFSRAEIAAETPEGAVWSEGMLLVMSFVCGMLVMPLLFSPTFFRVLHRSFVLWHTLLGLSLLAMIVVESGMYGFFFTLSPSAIGKATVLLTGLSIASAAMFMRGFIEEGAVHRMFRALLALAAFWTVAVSAAQVLAPPAWRVWSLDAYYWAHLPVLWLFATVLVDALINKSRSAKYLLFGLAPLMLVAAIRLLGQLTTLVPPTDVMALFYVGCVVLVLVTTMGVVDAFMGLRHQRDDAVSEAMAIEKRSERDPLTGLYNRGFLEENYARLHAEGFTSLAVVDLDFFKDINDTYGHATGDEVLRAVSRALERKLDVDTVAVRMGGEEFVLLLRGDKAADRADRRRRQIPRSVADLVELKRPVTASMGLVEAPTDGSPVADFDSLYAYADRLLYRAKESGRNRLVSERLSPLGNPSREAA